MQCKICGRERRVDKYFPRMYGLIKVPICKDCDNSDIEGLSKDVAKMITVEVDCDAYLRVK